MSESTASENNVPESARPQPPSVPDPVYATLDDFKKLQLRVATIKAVADHPNADRLYVLTVDVGGTEKQIVAGIRKFYEKDALLGKQIVVINNLAPAMLRGQESQGMLLAASDDEQLALITPDRPIASGGTVR